MLSALKTITFWSREVAAFGQKNIPLETLPAPSVTEGGKNKNIQQILNRFGNAERFFHTLAPRLWLEVRQCFLTDPGVLQREK